jgi:hypothetical protein
MSKFQFPNRPLVIWGKKSESNPSKPSYQEGFSNLKLYAPPVEEDEPDFPELEDEIFSPTHITIYRLITSGRFEIEDEYDIHNQRDLDNLEERFSEYAEESGFHAADRSGLYRIEYETL